MKNECGICGGGFGAYTAPEARCTCTKDKKKLRDDLRHTMVLAEYKYLLACGWKPTEKFVNAKEGFTWVSGSGNGPFTQDQAIDTQKAWDANPVAQQWHDLGCKLNEVEAKIKKKLTEGADVSSERRQVSAVIEEMKELTERRVPRDAVSAHPPHG